MQQMKMRKQISYEDIVEIGKNLIKEQTDFMWESNDDKEKAVSAYVISGIVDFLDSLDKATQMTQKEIDEKLEEVKHGFTSFSIDSEVLNNTIREISNKE